MVVAEKIPRVPDNRPGRCRVDIFVYKPNGDVVRCHPNPHHKEPMQMETHVMRNGSSLFLKSTARIHGVGESLHTIPPAWAERQNSLAPPQGPVSRQTVTRAHQIDIWHFDVYQWTWRNVEPILMAIPEVLCPLSLTDGLHFPWWIWLSDE